MRRILRLFPLFSSTPECFLCEVGLEMADGIVRAISDRRRGQFGPDEIFAISPLLFFFSSFYQIAKFSTLDTDFSLRKTHYVGDQPKRYA